MTAPPLIWQKSTYSQEQGDCVELAVTAAGAVLIRESDEPAIVLSTTPSALARFLQAIKQEAAGT
jgi:hypothetical protein